MALDPTLLEQRIEEMQVELQKERDPKKASKRFAQLLASMIDEFVREGQVTINGETGNIT